MGQASFGNIGTSSTQWDDGDNWSDGPDVCQGITVRDNFIRTKGNEGIEVKEGTVETLIEGNEVYMQYDAESGGIGSRGDRSIIRYNHIEDTDGAGVRLGGHTVDGIEYGANNQVYENTMVNCRASGIKVMVTPQGQICGNDIEVPDTDDDADYNYSGGAYYYDPLIPCDSSSSSAPGSTSASVTPAPEPTPEATTEAFAEAMNEESSEPTIESTIAPTPAATLEATPTATLEPTADATIAPTIAPTRAATLEPTTEPTPAATTVPTSEATIAPTIAPTPAATLEATPAGTLEPTAEATIAPTTEPTTEPTAEAESTCRDGIEGIDGRVVCCPLECGQCGGTGCSTSGAAYGLGADSCCREPVSSSGKYCDDTGEAPCIYGSAPDADDDDDNDDTNEGDAEDDDDEEYVQQWPRGHRPQRRDLLFARVWPVRRSRMRRFGRFERSRR
ncbi:FirrV-1-B30 precursor [Ectocarpus siliculosus]|uniref:FirrV-1-B30 n=1 Tax=Ectocarpus siliculosus TaxID=2880 RepID=D7FN04_ECTSI|nr:FirrV-1-B30 precursor [Ectocarpus siliculosus]|eukprot:CBJ30068.1 FirrV-1-B30 precursor [Ectocarpus siliculosus]